MIKIKYGKQTITNDVAYIAGFFDGEGCVRIKRANQGGNSYYITATITNSNKAILEYIKDIFGGKAICFGWSSMGLGKNRGFEMKRILLVPHGGSKNDTIVTVETKLNPH